MLWGACDALFTPRPLGPFVDVAGVVGGEFGELVEGGGKPYAVAAALLGELRANVATILVLEDVQWADEASLDVLRIVARRLETVPALVICTYRDDELDRRHPLWVVLGELVSAGARRLAVEPLSPGAVATLAGPHDVDADELFRKTAGNPFFVVAALAAAESGIPNTVRDVVLARVVRLSPEGRALLETVAVLPPQAELWLLEAVASEVVGRVEECLNSGLLAAVSGGVAFRHELARLAVVASLAPDRRAALHRAALGALTTPPGGTLDLARLADHAVAAGDGRAVLEYVPAAAARAASLGAHREAAAQYAAALRFSGRLEPAERAELLARRAQECYLTDQNDDAIEAAKGALQLYRELGDHRREGNALRELSEIVWCPGRVRESEQAGREAVAVLSELRPDRELAIAYCNLSMLCEDSEEAIAWGRRALELAEDLGDDEIVVEALRSFGLAEVQAGERGGVETLERALALAEERRLVSQVGRVFNNLVISGVWIRDYVLADRYLDAGFEYCGEHGLELYRLYMLAHRARSELDQGRWATAAESAALVLRVPRAATTPRILALVVLGLVRARQGDPDVWMLLDEAQLLAEPTGELARIGPVAAARAEAAWLEGRHEAVAEATEAALELARRRKSSWQLGELCYWRWRAGVREAIPPEAAEPYALQIAGDWPRAAELWTQIGCPYEAALAVADGDREDALRRALGELHRLGAQPAAAFVARRLRERGARALPRGPRRSTRHNPAGLTDRELDVLALITEGLHNAEIADRLFLSRKTVDHHVSAILRKLEVPSRGQAGVAAIRLGLSTQDR
jgi:DNA-binding CsgD family transcriptional regulator